MSNALRERFEADRGTTDVEEMKWKALRGASGMGFWRLACVIAAGVLLSQLVSGAVTWALGYLLHPPQ